MSTFLVFFGIVALVAAVFVCIQLNNARLHVRERLHTERLRLELNPVYRAKVEEDRHFQIEQQRIALVQRKQEFEIVKWQAQFQLDSYLQKTRVSPEMYLLNCEPATLTALPSLKPPPAALARVEAAPLVSPDIKQPTMHSLMSQLEQNALEVSPGVNAVTGDILKMNIVEAVHFKLIGSSGFGKSCLAAALLQQATTLNTPDVLQIALLDLEHKTSRLFEHLPHVLEVQAGKRRVTLASTNADEVAYHLQLLRQVLKYRAELSEDELERLPVLLIYVEEMLSLQYEVDESLLDKMLADLSVLALRARKYNMFLLACAQTDYSTCDLKAAQKQFRSRFAFAIDTTAARAAGFMSTDLIKYNFLHSEKGDGQFVVEYPGFAGIGVAPKFDVHQMLLQRSRGVHDGFMPSALHVVKPFGNDAETVLKNTETTPQADFQVSEKMHQVATLRSKNWGKVAIVEKLWKVTAGGSQTYKEACAEYEQIIAMLEQSEAH